MYDKQVDTIFGTSIGLITIRENTDILQTYKAQWRQNSVTDHEKVSWVSEEMRVLEYYPQIRDILLDTFISFSSEILGLKCDFTISTSWMTKCQKGESCQLHSHANCFWSGVYYYGEKYDESSSLAFQHPLISYIENYGCVVHPTISTPYNNKMETITPHKNGLVLFPSYLKHKILKHNSDIPRYSLAFNIVPVGNYGRCDSQYDTKWVT
tara:strand:- start:815 stop:1444 length:630 start_codon:yes stop_codon:yes gene_type:complete